MLMALKLWHETASAGGHVKHRLLRPPARVLDSKAEDKIKYLTFLPISGILVIVKAKMQSL